MVGDALYAAGVLGSLIAPGLALVMFIALPIVYAMTSEGLGRTAIRRSS